MWGIVTVRLPDGHVHEVRLRNDRKKAIKDVVQEARENGAVNTDTEAEDLQLRLESYGNYTDGDVRTEVIQVKDEF